MYRSVVCIMWYSQVYSLQIYNEEGRGMKLNVLECQIWKFDPKCKFEP